ncbi:NAD(P)/FAD-dependent oxidoreductase [Patescibacteria group bacterium]|nr:NAD(P)/FAD-dependent oxidoreductase [Patescibacteria group bacterium]
MKVAIIGAGACGLYLAWKLAEKGEDVTIFEKNNAIGNKVCSNLFSERILEFIPESHKLIEKKINSVIIHFPKKEVKVSFSRSILIIDHSKLDNLLAKLARAAGAKIVLNKNISKLPEDFDKIIGCDGAYSFIRKKLNLPNPFFRLGIQGFMDDSSNNNFVEAWPCKNGFSWKIQRKNETEYGVIANTNEAYNIFNKFLKQNKVSIKKVEARVVPQGLIIPKNEKTTLCGDAAGLTKPWSGGGVVWGLIGANLLLKHYPDFQKYRKEAKRFFLLKILISKTLTKAVYFFGFRLPFFLPKNNKIESDFLF